MTVAQVRDWLGKYFLLTTVLLGGYILLFRGTVLLRIDPQTATDCFQIIIPTLVAQLTTIFRFFAAADKVDDSVVPIPAWVVKWPPLLCIVLLVAAIVVMAFGNIGEGGQPNALGQSQFKLIVTFYVTVLNATTVFVLMRMFEIKAPEAPAPASAADGGASGTGSQ